MLRVALWLLFAAGVLWGWYSTTSLLGAASAFDRLFPKTGHSGPSGWANLFAISQFLAVTIGPAILVGAMLILEELGRRRGRRLH